MWQDREAMSPIALLHGGGQGSWVWTATIDALREHGATVTALDAPGCGTKRARDLLDLTVDDIVSDLIDDLRAFSSEPVMLVGHSLAGTILPRVAAAAPDRIARLVYLTCSAPLPGISPFEQMGRGRHGDHPDEVGRPLDPATTDLRTQYRAMFCNDMGEAEADAFLARLGDDMWPMDVMTRTDWRYDHLPWVPATYIVCTHDQSLPVVWQETFARRLHVQRTVYLDAGHQAMNTQPRALATMLLAEAGR